MRVRLHLPGLRVMSGDGETDLLTDLEPDHDNVHGDVHEDFRGPDDKIQYQPTFHSE